MWFYLFLKVNDSETPLLHEGHYGMTDVSVSLEVCGSMFRLRFPALHGRAKIFYTFVSACAGWSIVKLI
jgi:hypothetical protein